ncbi:hypothetical protein [Klebsiella pneumoniae]|uniref:hypothetical protein n=2 Tax=Klebsiella pneumoniae TaxID=573 RepID=UPI000659A8EA|nr:hypothetical protein [Klebsiella pneumoniae]ELA0395179.1 hypothetical protein [Klebsiella pneumoniae]KME92256.1 hypothetical protein SM17_03963 [Klebsiella pneumoniae]MDT9853491.1 hypothetical protein [Klebsiella pneumoniae]NKD70353.1 hypothetical protein [Klebsiella pneumoniae]HCB8923549.1 hypothetical protein [Klebsiella pneumoniae]
MATCIRKNCTMPVYGNIKERSKRLCKQHHATYNKNRITKEAKALSVCNYCGLSLAKMRNKKYCSKVHRQLGSRKILGKIITDIIGFSYWGHIQHHIKRSPIELASINGVQDITGLYQLYQRKAKHQRSYVLEIKQLEVSKEKSKIKLTPFIKWEVCHFFPVNSGGENTLDNVIIAPLRINRMLKDTIPHQGRLFSGLKASGKKMPLNGSLYDGLVARFGKKVVDEELSSIGKLKHFHGNYAKQPEFGGMHHEFPLLMLLIEELLRLGHHDIVKFLQGIRRDYESLLPIYVELVAVIMFYAILTGDRDRFLMRFMRIHHWFDDTALSTRHPFRAWGRDNYERCMYLLLRRYLRLFFGSAIESPREIVDLYNSFFSLQVVDVGELGEIVSFSYFKGRQSKVNTFFIIPEYVFDTLPRSGDVFGIGSTLS